MQVVRERIPAWDDTQLQKFYYQAASWAELESLTTVVNFLNGQWPYRQERLPAHPNVLGACNFHRLLG